MSLSNVNPSEIIYNATHFLPDNLRKLTRFVFHFTDVNNAASILNNGKILSRNKAKKEGLMVNDNASGEVINGTFDDIHDYARFYFRPKTPTQFHNEGIRSKNEIHPELQAHCPVPVFFLFDINKLLYKESANFTHESAASHRFVNKFQFNKSPEQLINAPFHNIYHYNPLTSFDNKLEIIKCRHAEVLVKDECDLQDLKGIICRNVNEAQTLNSLIKPQIIERYKNIIKVSKSPSSIFNNEYLQLKSAYFDQNKNFQILWSHARRNSTFDFLCKFYTKDFNEVIATAKMENYTPNVNVEWQAGMYLSNQEVCGVEIYLDGNLIYKYQYNLVI